MKNTDETLRTDPELDAVLAEMSDEVPPMPADFHSRWMSAVRAEAGNAAPAAEEGPRKAPVSLARWTRILSVAAVFVFLIGGTVIYRNSRKTLSFTPAAKESQAVMAAGEAPTADGEEPLQMLSAEPEAAVMEEAVEMEEAMAKDAAMDAAYVEDGFAANGAAEDAEADGAAAPALFAMSAEPKAAAKSAGEAHEAEAAEEAYEAEEYAAEEYIAEEYAAEAYAAETGGAAEAPAMPAATMMPTAAPTPLPAEPEAEEPAERKAETGFLAEAGAFLTDMGDFLLAALPYLAVLAVPAAAAVFFRRRKKRG